MDKEELKNVSAVANILKDREEGKEEKRVWSPQWYYAEPCKEIYADAEKNFYIYCIVSAKAWGYMPAYKSELGKNIDYLQKVYEGIVKVPERIEKVSTLHYAPWDNELHNMLITAHLKNKKHS